MVCPQVKVKCSRCGREFVRYVYGKGKPTRQRRWKSGQYVGYATHPHASITDSCICCGGAVEQITLAEPH